MCVAIFGDSVSTFLYPFDWQQLKHEERLRGLGGRCVLPGSAGDKGCLVAQLPGLLVALSWMVPWPPESMVKLHP